MSFSALLLCLFIPIQLFGFEHHGFLKENDAASPVNLRILDSSAQSLYARSQLHSDWVLGTSWESILEEYQEYDLPTITPLIFQEFKDDKLKVFLVIKNVVLDYFSILTLDEMHDAFLFGKTKTGEILHFTPNTSSYSYVEGKSIFPFVQAEYEFLINETITESKLKLWLSPSLSFYPAMSTNLFSKSMGRLHAMPSELRSLSYFNASVMVLNIVIHSLLVLFGPAPLFSGLLLFDFYFLSFLNEDKPDSFLHSISGLQVLLSFDFIPDPLFFVNGWIYSEIFESKYLLDNYTESSELEFNKEEGSPTSVYSEIQLSNHEKETLISELVKLPSFPEYSQIGPMLFSNLIPVILVSLLLFLPLVLTKNTKPRPSKLYQSMLTKRWRIPISFIICESPFICICLFTEFRIVSADFWPSTPNILLSICFIGCSLYPLKLFYHLTKTTQNSIDPNGPIDQPFSSSSEFYFLFEGVKRKKHVLFILFAQIVHSALRALIVVVFWSSPPLSFSALLLSEISMLMAVIKIQPFIYKHTYMFFLARKGLLIFLFGLMFQYSLLLTTHDEKTRAAAEWIMGFFLLLEELGVFVYLLIFYLAFPIVIRCWKGNEPKSTEESEGKGESMEKLKKLEKRSFDEEEIDMEGESNQKSTPRIEEERLDESNEELEMVPSKGKRQTPPEASRENQKKEFKSLGKDKSRPQVIFPEERNRPLKERNIPEVGRSNLEVERISPQVKRTNQEAGRTAQQISRSHESDREAEYEPELDYHREDLGPNRKGKVITENQEKDIFESIPNERNMEDYYKAEIKKRSMEEHDGDEYEEQHGNIGEVNQFERETKESEEYHPGLLKNKGKLSEVYNKSIQEESEEQEISSYNKGEKLSREWLLDQNIQKVSEEAFNGVDHRSVSEDFETLRNDHNEEHNPEMHESDLSASIASKKPSFASQKWSQSELASRRDNSVPLIKEERMEVGERMKLVVMPRDRNKRPQVDDQKEDFDD